jgi:AraC-like DNA-binding protein
MGEAGRSFFDNRRSLIDNATVVPPNLTLAAQYLRHIAEFLRGAGVDVDHWLGMHDLEEPELEDSALTLTFPLFRQLVLDGIALADEPALGLFVGERLVARSHGFVGYAAMNSRTMREVLDVLAQFLGLRISILTLTYEVRGMDVRVALDSSVDLGDIQRPVLEAVTMSVRNTLQSVSLGGYPITSVAFPFPEPDYADLARELIGCEVHWSAGWAGLTLPASVLDQKLKMADPRVFQEAAQLCERELKKLEANETWAGRVRRTLLESQNDFPSLQTAARLLRVTPRTLHRRLRDEDTSFRAILDDVRYRLASDQLRSGVSSIEEIAFALGYSDPANFRRAFKRWAGVPPSTHRLDG